MDFSRVSALTSLLIVLLLPLTADPESWYELQLFTDSPTLKFLFPRAISRSEKWLWLNYEERKNEATFSPNITRSYQIEFRQKRGDSPLLQGLQRNLGGRISQQGLAAWLTAPEVHGTASFHGSQEPAINHVSSPCRFRSAVQETQVWSLGQEDPLEKGTVT